MRNGLLGASFTAAALLAIVALPATAGTESSLNVSEIVPALSATQAEEDRVPRYVQLDDLGGVRGDTTRLIGDHDGYQYWVGRAGADRVCLVALLPSEDYKAAASCNTFPGFRAHGLALKTGVDRDAAPEAYLFPEGIAIEEFAPNAAGAGTTMQSNLMVVSSSAADALESSTLKRTDGSTFTFTPLSN